MPHYVVYKNEFELSGEEGVFPASDIINQDEYIRQEESTRIMVKEAAADVIMKMQRYQRREQSQSRISDAAKNTVHPPPPSSSNAYSSFVDRRQSRLTKFTNKSDSTNTIKLPTTPVEGVKDSDPVRNPYKRLRTGTGGAGGSLWATGGDRLSSEQLQAEEQRLVEKDRADAEEAEGGNACEMCASRNTVTRNADSHQDVAKHETWGFKEVDRHTLQIQCRDCKHAFTVQS